MASRAASWRVIDPYMLFAPTPDSILILVRKRYSERQYREEGPKNLGNSAVFT